MCVSENGALIGESVAVMRYQPPANKRINIKTREWRGRRRRRVEVECLLRQTQGGRGEPRGSSSSSGPADTMLRLNILCLNNQALLPGRNREIEGENQGEGRRKSERERKQKEKERERKTEREGKTERERKREKKFHARRFRFLRVGMELVPVSSFLVFDTRSSSFPRVFCSSPWTLEALSLPPLR